MQPLIQFLGIYEGFNKNESDTLAIFLDLMKDLNVNILLLEYYGFRRVTNHWFKNYLKFRSQLTVH